MGLLFASAGFAYLIKLAEEKQRHVDTAAKAAKARDAAAAHAQTPPLHGQHPPMPRK